MSADLYQSHPLFSIEYGKHDSNYEMPNFHYHNSYELYILEEGHHHFMVNDSLHDIKMYDVALFRPNSFHKSRGNHSCARTCLYFTERFLRLHFTERSIGQLLSCFDQSVISISKEAFPRMKKLLLLLDKENVSDPDNRIFIYLADILNLMNEHKQTPSAGHVPAAYANFAPILSYINQNYNRISKIEEIAEQFFISKYYLCHIFKEATGMTLIQYLNNIKIQHACSLLVNSRLSVLEIGNACGFNSSMYFCKIFKQALNVTPSGFRKRAAE
ncbi:AraC family transcriptional regulator [Paenibacillus sp. MMS20-IR301]|uniref:helix-turn-helix transcriptional regulator n=1 Tax=Paenibacillus sp. MMS20-IR301 TaxID=2895946 RepID=UPI0028E8D787|nr:AraC family transcriptional regulator [Paenibacillus sp. MMS20-IR301]WNS44037.1 AraC family transcriptional regulator [Paenibacillus sp. MMS20-IR301]